ncbi:hypothetical protein H696_03445 [Fonticula alba]|uniref:Actin n=1 Tax=Fonticula alba TaxID=691883 RepID=A0A058Z6W9_FONAL|nr:hypothetical protein H696_03445 [Fonticula alba]KCV69980.1 hypothetical protein H696_03445 [Fonticula alba]|eukprot:XP_009495586.1 hypothetical protein H696_03445 [Fonticula alba]
MNSADNQFIVIDNGSFTIKAGFAGEDRPQALLRTCIGHTKYQKVMSGGDFEPGRMIGNSLQEYRGLFRTTSPIKNGLIENWEDMEALWNHLYSQHLKVSSEDHPVLITDAALSPHKQRLQIAQVLFESYNVPALSIAVPGVLSLYSSGMTSGIALDSGNGVTAAIPVYNGFIPTGTVRRMDIGGDDITKYLQLLLRKSGYFFNTSAELDIVREMKERLGKISEVTTFNPLHMATTTGSGAGADSTTDSAATEPIKYLLPDNQVIEIADEPTRAIEAIFAPHVMGKESPGIHTLLAESIQLCDIDIRKSLYSNIILSGGNTLFSGFCSRLLSEIQHSRPTNKVRIYAAADRESSAWVGGSILAALSSFRKMTITYAQYDEDRDILRRKLMSLDY